MIFVFIIFRLISLILFLCERKIAALAAALVWGLGRVAAACAAMCGWCLS